ncbi:MAG: T9SS type A sorting domain-containing protein [Prevotella sp.]|nr:T9SS type A sorting domain-containing protein [Prevotella sp.]
MNLRRLQVTAISLLFSLGAFANGDDGTAKLSASVTNATIGDPVTLSVTVSGITNKTTGLGSDGSCNYSITIPNGLTTVVESPNGTSKNLSGSNGNGTYDHGTYTASAAGKYTFGLKVTTGDAGNTSLDVTFSPEMPESLPATDITSRGFTANWNEVEGCSYQVNVYKNGALNSTYNATGNSLVISDLLPSTDYTYDVYSVQNGIKSLSGSSEIDVTTLTPVIALTAGTDAETVLGSQSTGAFTVNAENLYDSDVLLAVSGDNSALFTLNSSSASEFPAEISYTFSPVAVGKFEATLTATSTGAQSKTFTLTGFAKPVAPVASAATNVESSGFTANWASVDGATNYIINVYDANGNVVDGYENLEVGNATSYNVDNVSPEQSYTYDVIAIGNGAASDKSNKISVTTPKGAVITYVAIGEFETSVGATAEKTIYVDGVNLTGDVTVSLDGDAAFSTNVSSIATTDGAASGAVAITFAPAAVGTYSATVSLATAGAKTKTVAISGKALPSAVTATAATAVSENGFTANWEGDAEATYVVTLTAADGTQTATETTGTSYSFTGLTSGVAYSYAVQVKDNGQLSYKSNEISVTTLSAPSVSVNAGKTSIMLTWNAVNLAVSYKAILYKNGSAVADNSLTAQTVTFGDLTANTAYQYEVVSVYADGSEISTGKVDVSTKSSSVYGQQIGNYTFEAWDSNGEPTNWNGFKTAGGTFSSFVSGNGRVESNTDVRPGTTGSKSARTYSATVSGTTANGNMTTGQIIAGAMSATDTGNHNESKISDSNFSQVLTARPDSFTVWLKYVPKSGSSSTAGFSNYIHGNHEGFTDPLTGNSSKYIVATANVSKLTTDRGWKRFSVPFDYTTYKSNGETPAYIITTFNTNSTPGGGDAGEELYVDDILLIYKPTLTIGSLSKNQYKAGDVISLPYTIEGTMSPYNLQAAANVVSLELSDATGNFDNPIVLTSVTTDESGTLTAVLPATLEDGNLYKLRVVTTNYPMTSKASTAFKFRNIPTDVVATEATDVTAVSFKANWEAAANAQSYVLTVKKANGDVLKTVETTETTATIAGLSSETSYSYTVKAVNDYLTSQNNSNVVTVKTAGGGSISYDGKTSFTGVAGQAQNATITVTGAGLIDVIHVLKSGSADFSIGDVTELNAEGGVLNVTYTPSTVGVQTASIKLSSKLVNPAVTITLTGTVLPQTVSTAEATDITMSSFTANWNASAIEGAKYVFTLYNAEGVKISSEEIDGTSKTVTGLTAATAYSYTVAVKVSGLTSEESAKQNVTTVSVPVIDDLTVSELTFTEEYGAESNAQKVTVSGTNLVGKIIATLGGDNAEQFALASTELSNGDELSITYKPTTYEVHSATVTLTTESGENTVTLKLSGTPAMPAVVALPATDIVENGYTANWESVPGATKYQVEMFYYNPTTGAKTRQKNVTLESTVTSYSYSFALLKNKMNSYVITAYAGAIDEYKNVSDTVFVSLIKPAAVAASEATDVTETGFTANWEASEDESVKYILTVTSNGVEVSKDTLIGTSKAITGLTAGTEYSYTVYTLNVVGLKSASASNAVTVTTTANEGGNTNPSDDPETPEDPTTAVSENSAAKLTVYPNPAVSVINISGVDAKSVSIYSSTGALVETTAETVINVSDLAAGLYHAVVVDNNGKKFAKSFIKE